MRFSFLPILLLLVPASNIFAFAQADPIKEMPVLASDRRTGVLDILMIAKTKSMQLTGTPFTAWVYEICRRASAVNDRARRAPTRFRPMAVCAFSYGRETTSRSG